ncbi:putative selenium-dependent hydroxylase accessory protein YqeC [Tetragenococcus halophilus]|uniref:selenium cofactor biosynthesis protein YqeC n=1 Tax=Tetragenococcus halophilus TaxID=51669 RepID=UPI001F421CDC|nr:selenium cofactor biosynthesis protein YqeC [Tetragenococcus halophilus]MCF1684068.1 putative selenium-dependent hydroxylase accessory protein YqeC [Tetragenococcus halophilus]
MAKLIDCFELKDHEVLSIVGSGGKTSLLIFLAKKYYHEKVLLSTTTKMGYPKANIYDRLVIDPFENLTAEIGITMVGKVTDKHEKKKISMPESVAFKQSFPLFDKVFLEADGSKQRPLKGWADFEPVVVDETTTTIGIVPLCALGQLTDETVIHRLPYYLKLVSAEKNSPITVQNLAQLIEHPEGLFAKARGEKILYINHVEGLEDLRLAKQVVQKMSSVFKKRLKKIIAGNTFSNRGWILWEK